ncbi:MAG: glycosyltransferase [Kiloniellales bacterium]
MSLTALPLSRTGTFFARATALLFAFAAAAIVGLEVVSLALDPGFAALLLFVIYQGYWIFEAIILFLLSSLQIVSLPRHDRLRGNGSAEPAGGVSVCIPAYNEARSLVPTLRSILAQDRAPDEIIVVNDGSSDETLTTLKEAFSLEAGDEGYWLSATTPGLRVIDAAHGGKAAALNRGLEAARGSIFVTVDADTSFEAHSFARLLEPFDKDPQLAMVAGVMVPTESHASEGSGDRPSLPRGVIAFFQTIEYTLDFVRRIGWQYSNSAHVMSGAFSSFRTHWLRQAGGFLDDTVTEDYEVVHRLRDEAARRGVVRRFVTAPDAIAHTVVPKTTRGLLRQRIRWFQGFVQTHIKYRRMIGRSRFGWFGALAMPVKTVDAIAPALFIFVYVCLAIDLMAVDQALAMEIVVISLALRIGSETAISALSLLIRQQRITPYYSRIQTAAMIAVLPVYLLWRRALWVWIGIAAYRRVALGLRHW